MTEPFSGRPHEEAAARPIVLQGGSCLVEGALRTLDVSIVDGLIEGLDADPPSSAIRIDARDLIVLPGLVDVHGDAFERQIMPRTGVRFPYPIALAETDRHLAGNGITTAYHGLTLSWEPGLRSVENGAAFMKALSEARPGLSIEHRVQLRWETFAFEAVDHVSDWLRDPLAPTLAFNDHTTSTLRKVANSDRKKLPDWSARAGLSVEAYLEMTEKVAARSADVPATVRQLADAARAAGCRMLSHDDYTVADRRDYRVLGAEIAEFPMTIEAARDAAEAGDPIVLGAPNVVRGGSHTGALNAADCIEAGLCSILASDYYYPSMIAAVRRLVVERGLPLAGAWDLVAANPAEAMGLDDRGSIASGQRADLVLMSNEGGVPDALLATMSAGRIVFAGPDVFRRLA